MGWVFSWVALDKKSNKGYRWAGFSEKMVAMGIIGNFENLDLLVKRRMSMR